MANLKTYKALAQAREAQRGNFGGLLVLIVLLLIAFAVFSWWWSQNNGADSGGGEPPVIEDPVDEPIDDPIEDPVDDPVEDPVDEPDPEPEFLTDDEGRTFSYVPVGDIISQSGPGFVDETVYRTTLLFPTEDAVFLNSQVYRYGGYYGELNGMEGGQCNEANYDYPWQDTFCEKRSRDQPLCPGGGHEGLDIRPATCAKNVHWAVAVEDARVIDIRRHWVTLQTDAGTLYNYLHLNMGALSVGVGDDVTRGQRIGKVSNDFYKSDGTSVPTTYHLHFEMYENYVADAGDDPIFTKVNPYMTLVSAYERKLRGE